MEFLLGLLAGVVFFAVNGACLYVGYRLGSRNRPAPQRDEEKDRKAARIHDSFQKLFNYDVDTALRRKQVTDDE